MKDKVRNALKRLLENVADHEMEDRGSSVLVDLSDLKRLMRWAQNNAHVWFEGDRVTWTGASVGSMPWLRMGMLGTVLEDAGEDGIARVEWDGVPELHNRVRMYHNEIKRIK